MNIFSDKAFLPEDIPHGYLLFPFWGLRPALNDPALDRHRFDRYVERGAELFRLMSLEEARAAVLPFHWEQVDQYELNKKLKGLPFDPEGLKRAVASAKEFAALAADKGKPVVVFFKEDVLDEVPLQNSIVFRTSLLASARRPNEYAVPYWMPDEVEETFGGELPLREKRARPVVGFCGLSPLRLNARTRLFRGLTRVPVVRGLAHRLGVRPPGRFSFYLRARALDAVARSREVRSNFILRDAWFGGAFARGLDRQRYERARREYVENMFGSDYVLCTRGVGNYSIRFYETLSSGRIPVFINTDCVLPFEEWIDWRQHCVWVEGHEVARVAEKVAEFHESLSDAEFKDRQRACRQLWLEWLSPLGFFKNFRRYFD